MEEFFVKADKDGNQIWMNKAGQFHRLDGPAIIDNGYQGWWVNGERHREDGPAVIWADGYQAWYKNGKKHRLDGPAITFPDGGEEYWVDGQFRRLNRPSKVKEVTMKDLQDLLGYEVKIVKG